MQTAWGSIWRNSVYLGSAFFGETGDEADVSAALVIGSMSRKA